MTFVPGEVGAVITRQSAAATASQAWLSTYRNKKCEHAVKTGLSTGATEHGGDRRRTPNLDGSQDLETMPPVERDVLGVRGFQVGWRSVLVTTPESMHQQG
jgi:hypothetical protein